MPDRPSTQELVEAVADFLSREVLPGLSDQRLRFRGLIAANVLTIVARELAAGEEPTRAEWQRLAELTDNRRGEPPARPEELRAATARMASELAERIRAGAADEGPTYAATYDAVYAHVVDKLRISNPKFLDRVLKEQ